MNQKSSLRKIPLFVSQALTANKADGFVGDHREQRELAPEIWTGR
ncbi:hypothetical protein ABIF29_000045 [Bradyrhizobium elkanii]|uniref:Uncharacterized protein n=1 Tax=Bradyrhizobium elkanii TaxID=29448 RepID=A0ABV4EQ34_BRAEL|nr:hypothetical protein [Bradyrhizobium elkanii]MCS3890665.1 hypothetical protein [Bradyrhizobium elkanii]MCS4220565.1 hypothetical protein [Bradyrhizobium elkanii]MCW2197859.1 hypothetical protein [Bradyrhizobium elkanii]MCW2216414.1 hypothetical protein [Bradyrhizobium elkanii]